MRRPLFSVLPAVAALLGLFRLAAAALPGDAEPGFDPNLGTTGNLIYGTMVQPDGKIVLAGGLTTVGGVPRSRAARLLPNGSLDTAFNPNLSLGPRSVTALPDGRMIMAGNFETVGGTARRYLARLNQTGTLDTAFNPDPNDFLYSVVMQPDGKMLLAGQFTTIGGTARNYIARIHADGSLDTGFTCTPDAYVRTLVLQPDGKIVIAGTFTAVTGTPRSLVARLNSNGTVDPAFNPGVTGDSVYCAALQPDGDILIGGTFTTVAGGPRQNLARLNADGTLDTGFNPGANSIVRSFTLQTDGKIILTGEFSMVAGTPRNRLARLQADGSVDTGFNPDANDVVFSAELDSEGRMIAGGNFTAIGGASRHGLARLRNDPATQSLTATATTRVQWMRGGASPETHQVTFELSTNGGSVWTALGAGTRIPGGWERDGLNLPAAGQIRARARAVSGAYNGSSSLLETVTSYAFTPLDLWRQSRFGSAVNAGDGADSADPDEDGAVNLLEFAFGLDPHQPDAATMPEWELSDDDYVFGFERPASVTGITYIAEQNTSLDPAGWTPIPNLATPPVYFYDVPAFAESRRYLRVRVTVP